MGCVGGSVFGGLVVVGRVGVCGVGQVGGEGLGWSVCGKRWVGGCISIVQYT